MTWRVRDTDGARDDLRRLFHFLLSKDPAAAKRAITQIDKGMILLREFPFTCRKADPANLLSSRAGDFFWYSRPCGAVRD